MRDVFCAQVLEASKRIYCAWYPEQSVANFMVSVSDPSGNVVERIRVPQGRDCSIAGALLLFDNEYTIQVGTERVSLTLRCESMFKSCEIKLSNHFTTAKSMSQRDSCFVQAVTIQKKKFYINDNN